MQLKVESKRRSLEKLKALYPGNEIIDVTSKGPLPWLKFSPFYPHGDIPIPFMPGKVAASVEGIWQGLKIFEKADIDLSKFNNATMAGLKRSVRANGNVLGHRAGEKLLPYREARFLIYLPSYRWVLDNYLQPEIAQLRELASAHRVILLDYETNADIENLNAPLSHAALIVKYLEGNWPG